ncbi:nitrogen fixation protein NifZ [Kosakonia pseudosacchari]|uniref:nitrogen fixation protein NifZ n=1 Tax=Kosakonia pseudosacchari TaxID=1646340 RepID=UPI0018815D41|nr:nitrogen fixation protein NifZ [Kosakonia pseudosacchari]QOV66104.1 nitrogen fixation protein NifZ [Kosakonia pseudosacchari]
MKRQYAFGEEVRVSRTIRNDGTMPGYRRGDVLVRRGSTGFVRECGIFLMEKVIYHIHFPDSGLIVGCREQELLPLSAPWHAGQFQYGDTVACRHALAVGDDIVVAAGEQGQITATGQGEDADSYTVTFSGRWFQVSASAMILLETPQ